MAGIEDFLNRKFTVKTRVPNGLAKFLPAKGSTFSFQEEKGGSVCLVVARPRSSVRFGGFKLKDGRLERRVLSSVLVIEVVKTGQRKVEIQGWLVPKDNTSMQGTWGAESGSGGGGGNTYPNNTGARAS